MDPVEIQIRVVGGDQAKRAFSDVGDSAQSFGKSIGIADIAMGSFIGNLASSALQMGVNLLKDAASSLVGLAGDAVHSADALQQNRIAFETMLGNADKAKKLLGDLQQFALATPFNLTDLQDYSKQLLSAGYQQEQIIPMLKTLGDVAAGVGMDKLPLIVHSFQQMESSGKLSGIQLREFMNSGVPALQLLVNYYNKVGTASLQAGQDTKANSTALQDNADKIQKINGQIEILNANFEKKKVAGKADTAATTTYTNRLSALNNELEKAQRKTGTLNSTMAIGTLTTQSLKEMIDKGLNISVEDVTAAFTQATEDGGMFDNMMSKQMNTISGITSNFSDLKDTFLRTIGGINSSTGDLIEGGLLQRLQTLGNSAMEWVTGHQADIETLATSISTTLGGALDTLGTWLTTHQDDLKTMFSDGSDAVSIFVLFGKIGINELFILLTDLANVMLTIDIAMLSLVPNSEGVRKGLQGAIDTMNSGLPQANKNIEDANNEIARLSSKNQINDIKTLTNEMNNLAIAMTALPEGPQKEVDKVRLRVLSAQAQYNGGSHASGGIIPGNQYSGDRVMARVNSGEMVLTRQDQSMLLQIIRTIGKPNQTINANFSGGGRSEPQQLNLLAQLLGM